MKSTKVTAKPKFAGIARLAVILFLGIVVLRVFGQPDGRNTLADAGTASFDKETKYNKDGTSQGRLVSFDDHPQCVLESLSKGEQVWLLDDCRNDSRPPDATTPRNALYVVFAGKELAFVIGKQYVRPGSFAKFFLDDKKGGTWWWRQPAGEGRTERVEGTTYGWNWQGNWRGDDVSDAQGWVLFTSDLTSNSADFGLSVMTTGATLQLLRHGADVRWKLRVETSGVHSAGKLKFPLNTESRNDLGTGRRL